MTPEQQRALAEVLDTSNSRLADEERGKLVMLVMANNTEGLAAVVETYLSDFAGSGTSLEMAATAERARQILSGEVRS